MKKKPYINKEIEEEKKNVQTSHFFCGGWCGFIGVEIARKKFIKHFKPMRCKECVILPF